MKTILSQSTVRPEEWDIQSSPTTVWHNYGVEEIAKDDETSYKYKTDKMTMQEYNLLLVKKLQEQQTVINTLLLKEAEREGLVI